MSNKYVTAGKHVPEAEEGETVLQIRDAQTKEIFRTRARVARDPDRLEDPRPLEVVRGPHENTTEQWYVELLEDDDVDRDRLEALLESQGDRSNVINTRSDDLAVLLSYLVETGHYGSTAEATRALLFERIAEEHPAVLEAYDDLRTAHETDPVREAMEEP